MEAQDAPRTAVREHVRLPADPASAARARDLLRATLTAAGRTDCLETAELLCTELVTNALLHAHTPVEVTVRIDADVRVEVRDFDETLPAQRIYGTHATTGRGLALVAALSDAHGVDPGADVGKTVWFVVGGPPRRPAVADGSLDDDVLAAWSGEAWDLDDLPPPKRRSRSTRTVRLLGLPPALWLAAQEHNEAILREMVLYCASHEDVDVDVAATDRTRSLVDEAVAAAIRTAYRAGATATQGPVDLAAPHPDLPAALDLEVEVPADLAGAFSAKQETLDAAERLAAAGRLLARPAPPEIVAVRDWECEQVVAQLSGVEPVPWADSDHARTTR